MLDGLLQAIENLTNFSFVDETEQITSMNSEEIVEMVRLQLELGRTGDGTPLYLMNPISGRKSFGYAPYTIQIKQQYGIGIGAIVDHITLYNTGEFYESLYLKIEKDGDFSVLSGDEKYPLLVEKSGDKILELSPQAGEILEKRYFELYQNSLNQALNGY